MVCDQCGNQFHYCFYINANYWRVAVGRKEGHQCAHCILEALGGLDWYIIWNEPAERMMRESRRERRELGP